MSFKAVVLAALVAYTEARFGQENPAAIQEIGAVTSGGASGVAATIAGAAISDLLAAANPCSKLQTGDKILAQLGTGADAVKAAQDFVAAEQNFNPFNIKTPTLCSDPSLPSSAQLRGILPKIDPAVTGADAANKLSAQSLATPFDATGKSVADVFAAQGFTNFATKDLAGQAGAAPASAATGGQASNTEGQTGKGQASDAGQAQTSNAGNSGNAVADTCDSGAAAAAAPVATTLQTVASAAPAIATNAAAASGNAASTSSLLGVAAQQAAENDSKTGTSAKTTASADFGKCVPTIFRAAGQAGRKNTEFTFQAVDPKISAIQGEALNPNIITNRICDELTNQCGADAAAKTLCTAAKAKILALGTRDQSTADAWNAALGF